LGNQRQHEEPFGREEGQRRGKVRSRGGIGLAEKRGDVREGMKIYMWE